MKTALMLIVALMLSLPACASAAQPGPALRGFLSTYVNGTVINGSSYYNQTVGLQSYVLMQPNPSSFSRFVVINATGGNYSLVTSSAAASSAIEPLIMDKLYPNSSTLSGLNSSMRAFLSSQFSPSTSAASPTFFDCVQDTGLSYHMCTSSTPVDQCIGGSCIIVGECAMEISGFGIESPFAYGVLNFSKAYLALNSSYNGYLSLLSGITPSNYAARMEGLQSELANISSITSTIQDNPLFPTNVSASVQTSVCGNYEALMNGPWWCYATGYCLGVTLDNTRLGGISSELSALQALPVSSSAIDSIVANSTALARGYINNVVAAREAAAFDAFLSSVLPRYNATVGNATALSGEINNASLSGALQRLESAFSGIESAGGNQNLTVAGSTLSSLMANVSSIYSKLSPVYGGIFATASNNTYSILAKELSFRNVPPSLSTLASEEQAVNSQLGVGAMNTSRAESILGSLESIKSGVASILAPSVSPGGVVKAFDGGLIGSLLLGSGALRASTLSGGALYAALISLAVAAVLTLLFYMLVYRRLQSKHKIKRNRRVARAWRLLFIAIFIVAMIYVALTYMYASSATTFLPFSSFIAALKGSKSVSIAYNGTVNSSVVACISSVKATLASLNKSVQTMELQNYSCTASSNSTLVGTSCLKGPLASMQPVILVSQGANSSIVYKGLYGRVLYATGAAASGASCTLDYLLNHK
jgi:hypothetical protein